MALPAPGFRPDRSEAAARDDRPPLVVGVLVARWLCYVRIRRGNLTVRCQGHRPLVKDMKFTEAPGWRKAVRHQGEVTVLAGITVQTLEVRRAGRAAHPLRVERLTDREEHAGAKSRYVSLGGAVTAEREAGS